MTNTEIITTLSTVSERQNHFDERLKQSDERLTRIELIIEKLAEGQSKQDQILEKLAEKQFKQEDTLEKLAEKQFKQDLKNEEIDNKFTRAAQLLMQSALNHAQANERFDRIQTDLEMLNR